MTGARHMRDFWDERAREDAWYFVDNRLTYGDPDLDEFWAAGERDLDAILAALDVRVDPGSVVVDLGCGVGRLSRALAARAREVKSIDVSGEMLALGREHNAHLGNIAWIQGDGTSLRPLPDAGADALVSHVVFQHIPDPEVTLGYVTEIGRVLRPGAWAAAQVSTDPRLHDRRRGPRAALGRLRSRLGRGPGGQDDAAWLGSAVDLDALRVTALGAGLSLDRVLHPGTQFTLVLLHRKT